MRRLGCERRETRDKEGRPVSALIGNNCDDCNVDVELVDVALEMTKLYLQYHSASHYITEQLIFETYKNFREKLKNINKGEEENED